MKLIKKSSADVAAPVAFKRLSMDRRSFLKKSGATMGGAAVASMVAPAMMRKAEAATTANAQLLRKRQAD